MVDRIEELDKLFVARNRTRRLIILSRIKEKESRRGRCSPLYCERVTQSSWPGIMKSKTSENFIASESNGVKRDQQLRQKQLKRGKECFLHWVKL